MAVRVSNRYRALLALRTSPHTRSVYPFGDVLHYTDARADVPPEQIEGDIRMFLSSNGFADAVVTPIAATVEDVFMARMSATEREDAA